MSEIPDNIETLDLTDGQRAWRERQRRVALERCRYYVPSGRAESFLGHLKKIEPGHDGIVILILRAGNSFGKSALACNLAAYLLRGKANPWFDAIPYLKQFKRPNRGRVYTTANAAKNTWDDEIKKWFPVGAYDINKEGTSFNKKIRFRNKSVMDFFTFDQDVEQAESVTLDWQIIDEPPSRKLFAAMKTRMRYGGLIVFVLTPLEDAAWMSDELEVPDRLGKDVFVTMADTEDACIEHGVRGHLPHASIEAMFKDFDEAERAARKGGAYLHLSGRIYKTYRAEPDGHCPVDIHPYHMDEWERGPGAGWTLWNIIDPHDRKPFAIGWYAAFRNGDSYTVAEWPDESWPPFHKIKDCSYVPKDYARLIMETERALGIKDNGRHVRRFIDPNFGNTPCFATNTTIKQELSAEGAKLGYLLNYQDPPDSLEGGHVSVKALLGDIAKGIRPKMYDLEHCKNHTFGMTRYGWAENRNEKKGISEKPELLHKDFADLKRYLALAKVKFIELPKEQIIQRASSYGKPGYRGV
jgi:phage terminase large subunit-like protein